MRCAEWSRTATSSSATPMSIPHSLICARILGRDPEHPPDKSLIVHRLQVALTRCGARFTTGRSTGWSTANPMACRAWCSIASATSSSARSRRRAWKRCAPIVEAAVRKAIAPAAMLWKNDAGARELEGLARTWRPHSANCPSIVDVEEGGVTFRSAARRRAEDGLVLRPGRESAGTAQVRRRRARARRLQLPRRVGARRAASRRHRSDLRRFVGAGPGRPAGDRGGERPEAARRSAAMRST